MFVFPKLCENCAFPQFFDTKKLDDIMVFYAVIATSEMILKKFLNSSNCCCGKTCTAKKT